MHSAETCADYSGVCSEPDENSAAAGKDTTVLAFRDKVQATAVTKGMKLVLPPL